MAIPTPVQEALTRLAQYNSNPISSSNPHGFGDYGNLTEFPRSLQDAATVAQWIAETGGMPGPRGEQGIQGLQGLAGADGTNGQSVELRRNATHIQWRFVGTPNWVDLVPLADIKGAKGDQGEQGREVELQTNSTHIQWRYAGEIAWDDLIALNLLQGLRGETGLTGDTGPKGSTGDSIELQKSATHVQWRPSSGGTWFNLVALTEIVGPKGETGARGEQGIQGLKGESFKVDATGPLASRGDYDGTVAGFSYLATDSGELYIRQSATPGVWSPPIPFGRGDDGAAGADGAPGAPGVNGKNVELRRTSTHLQWRLAGDTTWLDLVPLSELEGERGIQGEQGIQGPAGKSAEFQTSATHIQWRLTGDTAWNNLVALSVLTGPRGADGIQGPKGDTGETGAKGDTGLRGLQGDVGPKGNTGDTGPKGDAGDTGPKGDRGDVGPAGSDATVPDASITVKGKVQLATVADVRAAAAGDKVIVAELLKDSTSLVNIGQVGSTVTPDWSSGIVFKSTLVFNGIFANPINVSIGQTRYLFILGNSPTPKTLSFGTNYKGALPTDTVTDTSWLLLALVAYSTTHIVVTSCKAL